MKRLLDTIPQEYFESELSKERTICMSATYNPGGVLWGFLFVVVFFLLVIPSVFVSPALFPHYVYCSGIALCCLCAIYCILCVLFGGKKRSIRHPVVCHVLYLLAGVLFQLELLLLLSEAVMLAAYIGPDAKIDLAGSIFISVAALFALLAGMIMNLVMWRRMKRCIMEGYFKKGGKGFWHHWKHKEIAVIISINIAPAILSLSYLAIPLGKLWDGEANELLTPLLAVFAPLILGILFFLFSYINVVLVLRIYCIKRFGDMMPPNLKS